jgi:hypothetical protein
VTRKVVGVPCAFRAPLQFDDAETDEKGQIVTDHCPGGELSTLFTKEESHSVNEARAVFPEAQQRT